MNIGIINFMQSEKGAFFPQPPGLFLPPDHILQNIYPKKFEIFFKIINKKCAYGLIMKPHRVLDKYFEVYGQAAKITPEAGEKMLLSEFSPETEICET